MGFVERNFLKFCYGDVILSVLLFLGALWVISLCGEDVRASQNSPGVLRN